MTGVRLIACACCSAALGAGCGSTRGASVAPDASTADAVGQPETDGAVELPDVNPTPPPSIGVVSPSRAFLAREAHMDIQGDFTAWGDATAVDLGAGVVVGGVSASSVDALVVDFTVALDAAPGPRDVRVIEADGGTVVAPGAVTLAPPIALTFDGVLSQGSIAIAHVALVDHTIGLDTTSKTDPFGNVTYVDLAPLLSAGMSGAVLAATTSTADVELFIDEPTTGAADFDLVSGPPDAGLSAHFPSPAGVTVAPRSPATLVPGTPASGAVGSKYATALFAYTPTSASPVILDFTASSSASGSNPAVLLLPASGSWADELTGGAQATWLSTSDAPIYAVYFDTSGATGAFSVGLTATTPAATAQASAADATMEGAVTATALPFVLTGGQLTSSASQDWVRVTTGAGDSGKKLDVRSAGDPHTFLDVTVYDADGTTSIGGNENGGPVHASAGPVAASTTYFVVFTPGAGFDPSHGAYAGIIRLQ